MALSFLKSAAFWLLVLSCFICMCDDMGSGLANIWIRITPPISVLAKLNFLHPMLFDDTNTTKWPGSSALLPVTYLAYVIYVMVYGLAGLAIDGVIRYWGRRSSSIRGRSSI